MYRARREFTRFPYTTLFRSAKKVDEPGNTVPGFILGTPSYMAPEQARGEAASPAVDVYGVGAILYECLTGRPPFNAATPLETLAQVEDDDPVPPRNLQPRLPRDLETICLHCLRKEPEKRYRTVGGLVEDLRRFQAGEPILVRPAGPIERTGKWIRRHSAVTAAGLFVVVSVLAAGWLIHWNIARDRERRVEALMDR